MAEAKSGLVRVKPDLFGVLDKCAECGDWAGEIQYKDAHYVECTGCGQMMGPFKELWERMIFWNKEQRKLKRLKALEKAQSSTTT